MCVQRKTEEVMRCVRDMLERQASPKNVSAMPPPLLHLPQVEGQKPSPEATFLAILPKRKSAVQNLFPSPREGQAGKGSRDSPRPWIRMFVMFQGEVCVKWAAAAA